jgi:hypothetical protein
MHDNLRGGFVGNVFDGLSHDLLDDFLSRLLDGFFGGLLDHCLDSVLGDFLDDFLDDFLGDFLDSLLHGLDNGLLDLLVNSLSRRLVRDDDRPVGAHETRCALVVNFDLVPAVDGTDVIQRNAFLQAADNLGACLRRLADIDERLDALDRNHDIGNTNER